MKKLGIFIILISFIACQSEKKTNSDTDSTATATPADSLTFTYDSVKVYSKHPVSIDKRVTDTSKAVIVFPVFPDEAVNRFIQQKIMKTADQGKSYKSYQEYAADFIKGYDEFQVENDDLVQTWFLDIQTEVTKQRPGYLSVFSKFVNFSGGAHPNSVFTYLNYDPVAHQEILLDSLILPGSMPKLTAIAEQIFRVKERLAPHTSLKDRYFFKDDVFALNNNFTITDKGLKFLYNPYEIKAYVYGTTELTIPFAQLKGIARPNSLLSPVH